MDEAQAIDKVYRDTYDRGSEDDLAKTKNAPTVRYRLKAVCTGRLFRGTRPLTLLVSSHVSANEGWIGGLSMSMVFYRIFSGGGYCTKDGALAEKYLG